MRLTRRKVLVVLALVCLASARIATSQTTSAGVKNVVLVHGGFVDGSGWQAVYDALKKNGYAVSVAQNPTISLAGDVKVVKSLDPNGLDQEAIKAAKRWLFQPATDRSGKPVAVYVTLALSFRIF